MSQKRKQVILHLTDVHFGCDKSQSARALRQLALDGIIAAIRNLEPEWRPTILCLTGDVAYKGSVAEYEEASAWLRALISDLAIPIDHVVLCAGNHDIDRDSVAYPRPTDAADADKMLAVPLDLKFETPFSAYVNFTATLGTRPFHIGQETSRLVGQREIAGISFCSLNSAWFCRDKSDQGQLWIGRPMVDVMEQAGQVLHPSKLSSAPPTVFLIHHPRDWYHDSEIHARGRTNTFDLIAGRCHLILTGHTHGESRRPDRNGGAAHIMTGGATYADATYNNSFSLIQVEDDRFAYRTFDFDPQSASREWRQTIEATTVNLRDSVVQGASAFPTSSFAKLSEYRDRSYDYAQDTRTEIARVKA